MERRGRKAVVVVVNRHEYRNPVAVNAGGKQRELNSTAKVCLKASGLGNE